MSTNRIDNLRSLVAHIGAKQVEYHQFFPAFADRLEQELGEYLGNKEAVALCRAFGEFTFEQGSYRHAGLGLEDGRYRIPLMFKLKNLEDEGALLVRVRVYFTKNGSKLSAQIAGESPMELSETDLASLNEYIYCQLCKSFEESTWFEQNKSDYQNTGIGFISAP
jgi:hypothetical protein